MSEGYSRYANTFMPWRKHNFPNMMPVTSIPSPARPPTFQLIEFCISINENSLYAKWRINKSRPSPQLLQRSCVGHRSHKIFGDFHHENFPTGEYVPKYSLLRSAVLNHG